MRQRSEPCSRLVRADSEVGLWFLVRVCVCHCHIFSPSRQLLCKLAMTILKRPQELIIKVTYKCKKRFSVYVVRFKGFKRHSERRGLPEHFCCGATPRILKKTKKANSDFCLNFCTGEANIEYLCDKSKNGKKNWGGSGYK